MKKISLLVIGLFLFGLSFSAFAQEKDFTTQLAKDLAEIHRLIFNLVKTSSDSKPEKIPAPFAKAKEMVSKVEPDFAGRQMLLFEVNKNGELTIFILGFLPEPNVIGIGTLEPDYIVYEYHVSTGEFAVYVGGIGRLPGPADKVIEEAFKIFSELVKRVLI